MAVSRGLAPLCVEKKSGGDGVVRIQPLLDETQRGKACKLYARVTLQCGCSIGYHEHHGESETYYILAGEGVYTDNQTIRTVKPGDVTFTPGGCGHAIANAKDEALVFMALILPEDN